MDISVEGDFTGRALDIEGRYGGMVRYLKPRSLKPSVAFVTCSARKTMSLTGHHGMGPGRSGDVDVEPGRFGSGHQHWKTSPRIGL